jgi:hypothetical protein
VKVGDKTITTKGIDELKEDILKICKGDSPDAQRPTELATKAGSRTELTTFKREKPLTGNWSPTGEPGELPSQGMPQGHRGADVTPRWPAY